MRNKFYIGLFAIVFLCGLTALGSSPKFVGDLLESVQNNPIARIFSPAAVSESEKPELNSAKPISERPLTKGAPSSDQIEPSIPDYVLYDTVFRLDNSFRVKAQEQETAEEIPTAFKYYFKNEASLTDEEDLILKQVAIEFLEEVQPTDAQAQKIIEAGDKGSKAVDELNDLQEQRNAVVLSNRDKLANRLSEPAFGRFNQYVQGNFALHLNSYQVQPN